MDADRAANPPHRRRVRGAMRTSDVPVCIDGAQLEGGGQVVRVAMACSAVNRRATTVTDVRAGRPNPGLAAQHLAGVELLAALCDGTLRAGGGPSGAHARGTRDGGAVRRGCVEFTHEFARGGADEPDRLDVARASNTLDATHVRTVEYHASDDRLEIAADVGTAGSVALVLQAAMPWLVRTNDEGRGRGRGRKVGTRGRKFGTPRASRAVSLTLSGGTDVPFAPTMDYVRHALWPVVSGNANRRGFACDADVTFEVPNRGFYPRGGGTVRVNVVRRETRGDGSRSGGFSRIPARLTRDTNRRGGTRRRETWAVVTRATGAGGGGGTRTVTREDLVDACRVANEVCEIGVAGVASDDSTFTTADVDESTGDVDESTGDACTSGRYGPGGSVTMTATLLRVADGTSGRGAALGDENQNQNQNQNPGVHFGASRAWDVRSGETLRDVANAVAKELSDVIVSGAAVDDHMLDQLVVFLALGGGGEVLARNPISLHARTAMAVCEQAMPWVRFETTETNDGRLALVTCDVGTEPRDW